RTVSFPVGVQGRDVPQEVPFETYRFSEDLDFTVPKGWSYPWSAFAMVSWIPFVGPAGMWHQVPRGWARRRAVPGGREVPLPQAIVFAARPSRRAASPVGIRRPRPRGGRP